MKQLKFDANKWERNQREIRHVVASEGDGACCDVREGFAM